MRLVETGSTIMTRPDILTSVRNEKTIEFG
jgi:hypothetical protein